MVGTGTGMDYYRLVLDKSDVDNTNVSGYTHSMDSLETSSSFSASCHASALAERAESHSGCV